MSIVAVESWEYLSGDAISRQFTVVDENSDAVDVTTVTLSFYVMRSVGGTAVISTEASPATATISKTDAANGVIVLSVTDEVTDALSGTYRFELKGEDVDGNRTTIARGFVTFKDNLA